MKSIIFLNILVFAFSVAIFYATFIPTPLTEQEKAGFTPAQTDAIAQIKQDGFKEAEQGALVFELMLLLVIVVNTGAIGYVLRGRQQKDNALGGINREHVINIKTALISLCLCSRG